MEEYEFFYADIEADSIFLSRYNVGDFIHANNGVVASRLKGGLLTNCNVRFSFVPHPQGFLGYRVEDEDWKNQQLFIFDKDWRFKVEDRFFYDGVFQILMSHIDWEDFGEKKIIEAARKDFKKLYKQPPVDVLNNVEWKRRVRKVPGVDGKNSPYKGFLIMYWK